MSLIFFAESKKDTRSHAIIFAISLAMLFIGGVFLWSDIQTSAQFYAELGLRPVLGEIRFEGLLFGIFLSMIQIFFGYKAATEPNRKHAGYWVTAYFLAAIFDTYTDSDFRSYGYQNMYLAVKSLAVSVFVYNIFSEWAIGTGFKEMVRNLWAVPAMFDEMSRDHANRMKQQHQQNQSNPSGQHQPNPNGHKPPFPIPQQNKHPQFQKFNKP